MNFDKVWACLVVVASVACGTLASAEVHIIDFKLTRAEKQLVKRHFATSGSESDTNVRLLDIPENACAQIGDDDFDCDILKGVEDWSRSDILLLDVGLFKQALERAQNSRRSADAQNMLPPLIDVLIILSSLDEYGFRNISLASESELDVATAQFLKPHFRNFRLRELVGDILKASYPCRKQVATHFEQTAGYLNQVELAQNESAGRCDCELANGRIIPDTGQIVMTINNDYAPSELNGHKIFYELRVDETRPKPDLGFACSGTMPDAYLPASCRGQ